MSKVSEALSKFREINDTLDADDPDKIEILDSEDYTALIEWALIKRNEYLSAGDAAKDLKELYALREKKFNARADKMKDLIHRLMSAAGETKFSGVAGAASIRKNKPKVVIQDESKLPDECFEMVKKLVKANVKQGMPGTVMDNGSESLTVRVK